MSGLSEDQVQGELTKMVEFIKKEADEKAKEIELKTNEEYEIEKAKIVRQETTAIDQLYERKYKQASLAQQIQKSSIANKSRLKVLGAREDVLTELLETATVQLKNASKQKNYQEVLQGLIEEGLVALMEDKITIKVRKEDVDVANKAIPKAVSDFEAKSGIKTQITVGDDYLPADLAGGVIIKNSTGKIEVNNTLDERLKLLSQSSLPAIRNVLFGPSPSRKFFD